MARPENNKSQQLPNIKTVHNPSIPPPADTTTDITSTDITSTDITSTDITSTDITSTDSTSHQLQLFIRIGNKKRVPIGLNQPPFRSMQSTTPINYYDMGSKSTNAIKQLDAVVRGKHLLSRNADQISGREAIYTPLTGLRRMDHQFEPNFHELVNHVKSVSRRIQPYIDPQKRPAVINNVTYSTMLKFPEDNEDLVEGLIWFWLRKTCFRSPFSFGEPFSELTMATWKHLYGVDHLDGWPKPTELCERWRCFTAEQLLQKTEPATTRSEIETRRLSLISEYKVFIHIKITETLTGFCMSPYPVTLSAEILRMVERALTLAIAMSLHRSRIQVMGQPFVVEPQRNGLRFAHLTPGLVKWGDEEGKQFKEGEWLVMPIGLNVFPDALHFHSPSVNGYSTSRAL